MVWLELVAQGLIADPEGAGRAQCKCAPCQRLTKGAGGATPKKAPAASKTPKTAPAKTKAKKAEAPTDAEPAASATRTKAAAKGKGKGRGKSKAAAEVDDSEELDDIESSADEIAAATPTAKKSSAPATKRLHDSEVESEASAPKRKRARVSAPASMPQRGKKSSASLMRSVTPDVLRPVWEQIGMPENNQFTTGDHVFVPVRLLMENPLRFERAGDDINFADTTDADIIWWPGKIKTMLPSPVGKYRTWKYRVVLHTGDLKPEYVDPQGDYEQVKKDIDFPEDQIRPVVYQHFDRKQQKWVFWLPANSLDDVSVEFSNTYHTAVQTVIQDIKLKMTDLKKDTDTVPKWVIVHGPECIRVGHAIRLKVPGSELPQAMVITSMDLNPGMKEGKLFGEIYNAEKTTEGIRWRRISHPPHEVVYPSPDVLGKFYWKMNEDQLINLGACNDSMIHVPEGSGDEEEQIEEVPETPNGNEDFVEPSVTAGEVDDAVATPDNYMDISEEPATGDEEDAAGDEDDRAPATQAPDTPDETVDNVPHDRDSRENVSLPVIDLDSNRRIAVNLGSRKVDTPAKLARQVVWQFSRLKPRGGSEVILPHSLAEKLRKDHSIYPTDIGLCYLGFDSDQAVVVRNKDGADPQDKDSEIAKLFANARSARVRLGGQKFRAV